MSNTDDFLSEESIRLESCIKEPIRTPGNIQPHGALLAVDKDTLVIEHASQSCGPLLGQQAELLIGRPITEVLGERGLDAIRSVLASDETVIEPLVLDIRGSSYDMIVTASDRVMFVEFEPVLPPESAVSISGLYAAMNRLGLLSAKADIWAQTAIELRRLLSFDRVMVYHFHPDEHGEVVAEERADDMEPYKGLHYPASDIPAQARRLYLTKLSRIIADSSVAPSDLVSATDEPLDLSVAELRSVSPHHLEFMHNMGQASTFSLSLVKNGRLIGMITCAHRTPRRLSYRIRKALEMLAAQVAMQLGAADDIVRLERLGQFRSIRDQLVAKLAASGDLEDALLRGEVTARTLVPADGVAIRLGGTVWATGAVPAPGQLELFADRVFAEHSGTTFATDSFVLHYPELAPLVPSSAGAIVVPVGSNGGFIAWFRKEVSQSVEWLGDLTKANRPTTLSPRTSFSAWTQSVTGRSLSWEGMESEAAQLGLEVERALARHVEAELAGYAMHDALTGLPNRRLLMDKVERALVTHAHKSPVSLLFIDLDGFKAINDELGHEAGDEVLMHTATQLLSAIRTQDTVARLGGDEFVVLCEHTSADEADVVAGRIAAALRSPVSVAGQRVTVSASIGTVAANPSFSAAELLREADAAMYRAKINGRNRSSR